MKYFDETGHLDDQGIARYVDALRLDQVEGLPEEIQAHVNACTSCHIQAIDLYAILSEADRIPQKHTLKPRIIRRYWMQIAAAVALIALSILFFTREQLAPPEAPILVEEKPTPPQTPIANNPVDTTIKQKPFSPKETTTPKKGLPQPQAPQLIAAHFTPHEELDEMVGDVFRDEGLNILSPAIAAKLTVGQAIDFAWAESSNQRLFLYLLNNRGEEVHKAILVANRFQLQLDLPAGLYYWKLENEDDLLYIGKFSLQ